MYRLNRLIWTNHLAALFSHSSVGSSPPETAGNGQIKERRNNCERKVLPPELSKRVTVLTCESSAEGGVCDVYLVGTNHLSKESRKRVQAVIEFLKPEAVFLELCSFRCSSLDPRLGPDFKSVEEAFDMLKKLLNPYGILYNWRYSQAARHLGVASGGEFRVAYEEAMKYGAKVILGDIPIHITMHRSWTKMPLGDKTKLLYEFLFRWPSKEEIAKIVKMDDDDADVRIEDTPDKIFKMFPTLGEVTIDERDQYMSAQLLKVAREHNSVVAVVGKGHIAGIQKYWKQDVEVEELLNTQVEENTITLGKIVAVVAISYCIRRSIKKWY